MGRLSRFLLIERSRRGGAEAPAERGDGVAERIEGTLRERAGPAAASPAASGADLERFAPPPPASLELATDDGRRPFTRCMRCGMDHNALAVECTGCGAVLDTAEQRAFNDRLWAARQEEAARERAADAERAAQRERDAAELAQARRAMAESLAREVGDRERRRLDAEGFRGGTEDALAAIGSGLAGAGRWLWRLLIRPVDPP